jgi:hypothetical protein
MKPSLVLINKSEEDLLNGKTVKVNEIRSDRGEVDYRIQTDGGDEFWVPSENTTIIH